MLPIMALNARARSVVVLIATVAAVLLTANLGAWQLRRAAHKVALQEAVDARARLPALSAADLATRLDDAAPQHYRLVRLRGRWLAAHSVFLENRQMQGRVGFYLVTPLQLEGRDDAVLVQRGWVPRNLLDRTLLPRVPT
ncbi:MAG: SURF1 family protein, partial [Burkholderiaceae bacterium]